MAASLGPSPDPVGRGASFGAGGLRRVLGEGGGDKGRDNRDRDGATACWRGQPFDGACRDMASSAASPDPAMPGLLPA